MTVEQLSETIEVFVLAESRLVREALARVLRKKAGIQVVAAEGFSAGVVENILRAAPHVVLLDWTIYACSELEVISSLHSRLPGVKMVMIGMDADPRVFLSCVRAGVTGYVLKEASASEIATAVQSVAYDEAVCPPKLCLALFDYFASQSSTLPNIYGKSHLGLSRREQQLVGMMRQGFRNKEIAAQLNLSEQTVRNHVHRILRKLNVTDRLEAVEFCRQQGLFV